MVIPFGVIALAPKPANDSEILVQVKETLNRAPKISYPAKDIRGRQIPHFNYLMVMPACTSCSQFRPKSQTFMSAHPDNTFLIMTPDLKDLGDLLKHDNYFVVEIPKKSEYSKILPGSYLNE